MIPTKIKGNNDMPDFKSRKIALNIMLFVLLISLMIVLFGDKLFEIERDFEIKNKIFCGFLAFFYLALLGDTYFTKRRMEAKEKIKVPNEFKVFAFKQNLHILLYTFALLFDIFLIISGKARSSGIVGIIFSIALLIFLPYFIYNMIKRRYYSLEVKSKNIKIFFKNEEIESFEIKNISLVKFFGIGVFFKKRGFSRKRNGGYPIMKIYAYEIDAIEIPLTLRDYWLLKNYFKRYRVNLDDTYVE